MQIEKRLGIHWPFPNSPEDSDSSAKDYLTGELGTMCKEEGTLLVCDVCLRTEITPVLEASDPVNASLLKMYMADDGCRLCADCLERGKGDQ